MGFLFIYLVGLIVYNTETVCSNSSYVLVVEDNRLRDIFTEGDLVRSIAAKKVEISQKFLVNNGEFFLLHREKQYSKQNQRER